MHAQALLPIRGKETLKVGSADAGREVRSESNALSERMKKVYCVNLKYILIYI
jgi:hypothetical protein